MSEWKITVEEGTEWLGPMEKEGLGVWRQEQTEIASYRPEKGHTFLATSTFFNPPGNFLASSIEIPYLKPQGSPPKNSISSSSLTY